MKKSNNRAAVVILLLAVAMFCSWRKFEKSAEVYYPQAADVPVTLCGTPSVNWLDTTYIPAAIIPGLGNVQMKISTSSQKAQDFFNQGIRLIYGFNHWEAIQAFREATRLDSDCAMNHWGMALAYGPNLNDVNPKDRERIAFEYIQKALAKKNQARPVEQDLIEALATRYDGKAHEVRDTLNMLYANAMKVLVKKYPNESEVLTLTADAIMNTMPWDYWDKDGTAKPATEEAKQILEDALKKFPEHAGAHHLYIHLVEASDHPELALPSAQFLENAMPGAGHIIHMPAHIYLRTGQYSRSIELNQRAAKVDEAYLARSANEGMYRVGYYPHNVDFISFSSYMEGRSALGIQTAMKLAYKGALITNTNPAYGQYFSIEPMLAFVRFGKWEDILSLPQPDASMTYVHLIWRFSRGLAFAREGQISNAKFELTKLDSLSQIESLKDFYFSFNPASAIAKVPLHILRGEILLKQGNTEDGLKSLREAVAAEDNLRYMEPPDWKIPARHYLGAALIAAKHYSGAEEIYLQDLKKLPENGWSLIGLQQCQEKQNKKSEALKTAKRFSAAWKNADVRINSSRF